MLKNLFAQSYNFLILAVMLPVVYGCNSDESDTLGSLFNDGGTTSSSVVTGGTGAIIETGEALASIHSPEPATMLLIGSGLIAMKYYQGRKK